MTIQILGGACTKCRSLETNARIAVETAGVEAQVVKITDTDEIFNMGVMITPAIAIDGTVKRAGEVPTVDEIVALILGE